MQLLTLLSKAILYHLLVDRTLCSSHSLLLVVEDLYKYLLILLRELTVALYNSQHAADILRDKGLTCSNGLGD